MSASVTQKSQEDSDRFIREDTQFHLGFLPTEQSNPLSRNVDQDFARDSGNGVRTLQKVDRNVLAMAKKVLNSPEYRNFCRAGQRTIKNGGRIIFSGCGATGRLSILLESMWKKFCHENQEYLEYADRVESIMTGGDYALIKSVEFFEDFHVFGQRQATDANIGDKDMLVAITEGGETSSVLGTVAEAGERGADVFLLFNNPADLLSERLERSREAIESPFVTVLDLCCGPMAIAGSTRMQATTSEQLIAGSMLEHVIHDLTNIPQIDYAKEFQCLLEALETEQNIRALADYIEFEEQVYCEKGLVTYMADNCMLDLFTDTTERSPTFKLPPFRKKSDRISPQSWAFVKNPIFSSMEAWKNILHRPFRCLDWKYDDYRTMGTEELVKDFLPAINEDEILKFEIGNENISERRLSGNDAVVLFDVHNSEAVLNAYRQCTAGFKYHKILSVGNDPAGDFCIRLPETGGALAVMEHMAVKLVINTISTGTMIRMGRITGNWMSWVECTNKKLVDRGIRLVSEVGKIDYRTAGEKLFYAIEILNEKNEKNISPVQYALEHLL